MLKGCREMKGHPKGMWLCLGWLVVGTAPQFSSILQKNPCPGWAPQEGIPQGLLGAGSPADKTTLKIAAVTREAPAFSSASAVCQVAPNPARCGVFRNLFASGNDGAARASRNKQDRKRGARSGCVGGKGVLGFLEGFKCLVKHPHPASKR